MESIGVNNSPTDQHLRDIESSWLNTCVQGWAALLAAGVEAGWGGQGNLGARPTRRHTCTCRADATQQSYSISTAPPLPLACLQFGWRRAIESSHDCDACRHRQSGRGVGACRMKVTAAAARGASGSSSRGCSSSGASGALPPVSLTAPSNGTCSSSSGSSSSLSVGGWTGSTTSFVAGAARRPMQASTPMAQAAHFRLRQEQQGQAAGLGAADTKPCKPHHGRT